MFLLLAYWSAVIIGLGGWYLYAYVAASRASAVASSAAALVYAINSPASGGPSPSTRPRFGRINSRNGFFSTPVQTLISLSALLTVGQRPLHQIVTMVGHLAMVACWLVFQALNRPASSLIDSLTLIGFIFVVGDVVALLLTFWPRTRTAFQYKAHIVGPMISLVSCLGWPVALAFVEPNQPLHAWGAALWGLAAIFCVPLSEGSTSAGAASPSQFQVMVTNVLYGGCLVCTTVQLTNWSAIHPALEDWHLLTYLAVPITSLWLVLTASLRSTDGFASSPKYPSSGNVDALQSFSSEPAVDGGGPRMLPTLGAASALAIAAAPTAAPSMLGRNCVADLAHEVRTPLNALLSSCTLLADTPLTPEQLEYVNIMMACGSQITNNINFVLDMAKLEQKKLTLENKPINIYRVCEDVKSIVQHLADQKQLQLTVQCCMADSSTPCQPDRIQTGFLGDASRLKQALLNLMTNSIKFTDEGSVSMTILPIVPPSRQSIGSRLRGGALRLVPSPTTTVRIEITDTGIGMSEEQQKRLFQPFEQASSETYGKYGGTGLGLVISKQLIELMHGSIRIDATRTVIGKGSTFVIDLPLPEDRSVPAHASMPLSPASPASPSKVLCMSDSEDHSLTRPLRPRHLQDTPADSLRDLVLNASSVSLAASTHSLGGVARPALPPLAPPPPPPQSPEALSSSPLPRTITVGGCDVQIRVEQVDAEGNNKPGPDGDGAVTSARAPAEGVSRGSRAHPSTIVLPPLLALPVPGSTSIVSGPLRSARSMASYKSRLSPRPFSARSHLSVSSPHHRSQQQPQGQTPLTSRSRRSSGSSAQSLRSSRFGYDQVATNAFDREQSRLSMMLTDTTAVSSSRRLISSGVNSAMGAETASCSPLPSLIPPSASYASSTVSFVAPHLLGLRIMVVDDNASDLSPFYVWGKRTEKFLLLLSWVEWASMAILGGGSCFSVIAWMLLC